MSPATPITILEDAEDPPSPDPMCKRCIAECVEDDKTYGRYHCNMSRHCISVDIGCAAEDQMNDHSSTCHCCDARMV